MRKLSILNWITLGALLVNIFMLRHTNELQRETAAANRAATAACLPLPNVAEAR